MVKASLETANILSWEFDSVSNGEEIKRDIYSQFERPEWLPKECDIHSCA